MEWSENTNGNRHYRHLKNSLAVTSYGFLCLGLSSNS